MSALSPRQMFLLDEACKPIAEAFEPPYLVGTAAARQDYRDVDVRLILEDAAHERLRKAVGWKGLAFLGLAVGEYLAARTGLPIDFQIQQQSAANHHHPEGMRNPLGLRHLSNYTGDAPLMDQTDEPHLRPCPLGVCCAPEGHDGTCDEASGWSREEDDNG
jgi:hypothetical protein